MGINQWVSSIAEAGMELINRNRANRDARSMEQLCAELTSSKGEAMGTAIAQQVVSAYEAMDDEAKLAFFNSLLNSYSVDREAILQCADEYQKKGDSTSYNALNTVVAGPRKDLFRGINMAPNGTETVVKMREDLLRLLPRNKDLEAVDNDLLYLLRSWFNRGFLTLQTIDWRTPAHILEKLIADEAVHEMQGWDDLRRRLADDRRCFAFFHPALPDEPLIFMQVALVKGLAGNVQALLAEPGKGVEKKFDTAIFYSISNCQEGLKGISFGNFLIKQVVMELRNEFPQLKRFATLSPIPGFRRWLNGELESSDSTVLTDNDTAALAQLHGEDWYTDDAATDQLKPLLLKLCTYYLLKAEHGEKPLDPVSRFHLRNGARIERLNWLGDISANGISQSAGILVNYGYQLGQVEENHEAYINEHTVVSSKEVQKLIDL